MRTSKESSLFDAQIVAGALLLKESRQVAKILLKNADKGEWYQLIVVDNVLQKKSPATAQRLVSLIKNRLTLMKPDLWKLISTGNSEVATQALFAATIKQSHLLREFIHRIIKPNLRVFNKQLHKRDWRSFIEECRQSDEEVASWSESTIDKLGQVVFRILAEARYIDNTRSLRIIPFILTPEIRQYLKSNNEDYVLNCMEPNR